MTKSQPDTLIIHLNGQPQAVPAGTTLEQALALLMRPKSWEAPHGVLATAVNGQHIARSVRAQTLLAEGDQITTFEPITGG